MIPITIRIHIGDTALTAIQDFSSFKCFLSRDNQRKENSTNSNPCKQEYSKSFLIFPPAFRTSALQFLPELNPQSFYRLAPTQTHSKPYQLLAHSGPCQFIGTEGMRLTRKELEIHEVRQTKKTVFHCRALEVGMFKECVVHDFHLFCWRGKKEYFNKPIHTITQCTRLHWLPAAVA